VTGPSAPNRRAVAVAKRILDRERSRAATRVARGALRESTGEAVADRLRARKEA
jgi:hypothetical protein